ncbi:MAG: 3',5'-cyclic-AMP phosphodiesterase [Pseudomonadota bacterium]|nr:3',5'-cyclic-AMP phosphodiesterase [Pseudomonadota bacterium]
MQILQITDPHLYGNAGAQLRGVETDSSLRNVLERAFAHDVDYSAILVTGDLVQDDPSGYLRFKSILCGLQTPVLCIPGNHDEPAAMRRSLEQEPFQYCGTRTIGAWQFIMLDSYESGHVGGRLAAAELGRLDACLAKCAAHTLVCLHHHPVRMGSRWLDGVGLGNAEEFWRVIDRHGHVRAVAWGHVHQAYDGERNGVRLMGTPSTCAQFLPHSDRYALDSRPPAYRRLELRDDGRIDTQVHWVERASLRPASAG